MEKYLNFGKNKVSMKVEADDGRIYLPKETREKHGTKFEMIEMEEKIILVPISENPLEELRKEWEDVDKSVEELKKEALKAGTEKANK